MSQPDQAHSSFQILRPRIPILRISTGTRRANHRVACIIEMAHDCLCFGMWQYMIVQQSSPSESHCIEILEHGTRQSFRTNPLPLLTCLGEIPVCQRDFLSQNGYRMHYVSSVACGACAFSSAGARGKSAETAGSGPAPKRFRLASQTDFSTHANSFGAAENQSGYKGAMWPIPPAGNGNKSRCRAMD